MEGRNGCRKNLGCAISIITDMGIIGVIIAIRIYEETKHMLYHTFGVNHTELHDLYDEFGLVEYRRI